MKILIASSAGIYDDRYPETKKNNSGFGHMIRTISGMLAAENNEVHIITQSNMSRGRKIENAILYKKSAFDLVRHFKWFYFRKAMKLVRMKELSLGMKARTLLYFMNGSYCEDLIKKEKYDIVHINGIGSRAMPYLFACVRTNTPFAISLHGLISFDETVKIDECSKKFERLILQELCDNPNIKVSVVSTGIKKRVENYLNSTCLDNIVVINNPIIK